MSDEVDDATTPGEDGGDATRPLDGDVAWEELAPAGEKVRHGPSLLGQIGGIAAVVAVLVLLGRPKLAAVVLVVAGTVTVATRVWPRFGHLVATVLARFGHVVGRVLTVVMLGLFEILFVAPVAALLFVFRVDLLSPGRGRHPSSQWERLLPRKRPLQRREYADERRVVPRDPSPRAVLRQRLAGAVTGLVFVAVAAGIFYLIYREGGSEVRSALGVQQGGQFQPVETPALRDQPNAQELFDAHNAMSLRDSYAPFTDYGLATFLAPGMNLTLDERLTYQPDDPGDDPVVVWVFGGSAAWGVDQSDERTIPSTLAREAEAAGLDVLVRNFAVPSFVSYQSAMSLAERLASGDRPDVVVFYDGFNDVEQTYLQLTSGSGTPDRFDTLFATQFGEMLTAREGYDPLPGGEPITDPEVIVATALDRYDRAVDLVDHLAVGYGFEVVYSWQPDLFSKRLVEGEEGLSAALGITGDTFAIRDQVADLARERLPDGVIDLSGSLDDVDAPVLVDQVHTSEVGAAAAGAALFEAIESLLVARAAAP